MSNNKNHYCDLEWLPQYKGFWNLSNNHTATFLINTVFNVEIHGTILYCNHHFLNLLLSFSSLKL